MEMTFKLALDNTSNVNDANNVNNAHNTNDANHVTRYRNRPLIQHLDRLQVQYLAQVLPMHYTNCILTILHLSTLCGLNIAYRQYTMSHSWLILDSEHVMDVQTIQSYICTSSNAPPRAYTSASTTSETESSES